MARTWPLMDIVVRPAGDAATVMTAIRRTIRGLDAEVALANVRPMTEWVWASAAQPRLNATLLAFFACVSLLVAAIGTYGVLAYSVAQRTKELGLRMALGADRAGVLGLVLREGMTVAVVGILAGAASGAGLMRVLSALVFGVPVRDPWIYAGVSAILTLVAILSCILPALRASRVDPMQALRLD
jgi:putative ABC transport system permease protein